MPITPADIRRGTVKLFPAVSLMHVRDQRPQITEKLPARWFLLSFFPSARLHVH
jgi:hypothetical protein